MQTKRSEEEIDEQLNKANERQGRWPGMSYEEGVDAALRWVMGWTDEVPMSDD